MKVLLRSLPGENIKLRVKAALEDMSMQAFVARVVAKAVKHVPVPADGNHRSRKEG